MDHDSRSVWYFLYSRNCIEYHPETLELDALSLRRGRGENATAGAD